MKNSLRPLWESFTDIFNLKNEEAKGRTIILSTTIWTALYSVFIGGVFYTGFLSMYGISITGTGILAFVPYVANLLCLFSSKFLSRFQKRKKLLLTAKLIYFLVYIVGTTIMPKFVTDPGARLICFIIIIIGATAFYAPFSPGFTTWFYNFYPADNGRRSNFLLYMQIISTVLSSVLMIGSSILTDALSNSPYQNTLILGFRYLAFAFVLIEIFIQSKAKEYPYEESEETKIKDIFTKPFRYKKFLYCMLLLFVWNYIIFLPNNLWDYHLLNHLEYSYTLITSMKVAGTVILLLFSFAWQKILRRFSWIKTLGIALLAWVPTEFALFFLNPDTELMYVVISLLQNVLLIGINLTSGNIVYINLPEEDATTHIAFYTVGINLFGLLSIASSTYLSSITGDQSVPMFGMDVYSIQFMPVLRTFLMLVLGLIMVIKWRTFSPERDIAEVEHYNAVRKKYR